MDEIDRNIKDEIERIERRMGRMLRNMSMPGMGLQCRVWRPAVDVYETEEEIVIYMDTAGIEPAGITVSVERTCVVVSGVRKPPAREKIRCIHQLEMEHGYFERSISLPGAIDVAGTSSASRNGILEIKMPKEKKQGMMRIKVD